MANRPRLAPLPPITGCVSRNRGVTKSLEGRSRSRPRTPDSSLPYRPREASSYPGDFYGPGMNPLPGAPPSVSQSDGFYRGAPGGMTGGTAGGTAGGSLAGAGAMGMLFRGADCATPVGFMKRSSSEDCLKCMLKIPHEKCEGHKYIRVGGGYRHSYLFVKAMLDEIELQRQRQLLLKQRLEAIQEGGMKAIKTYIRTKSGKLVERIVFLTEEEYQKFLKGGKDAEDILKQHLSKEEADNLVSWDKEEQKAIITYIRTKSGRRIQKLVYVSKEDYEAMKRGDVDAKTLLQKYIRPQDGETIEGWGEAEMKAVTMKIRTKSGRIIEKVIMVSKEDYEKLQKGGNMADILGKYAALDEGQTLEGWKKKDAEPMRTVKVMVRTKSGRLVEKTLLMTEEEFRKFEEAGGDPDLLRKYLNLGKDDVIEDWEKGSIVYDASDDEALEKAVAGTKLRGKDGKLYEVVVDPITGKKYKRLIKEDNAGKKKGKIGKGKILGAALGEDPNEKGMTKEQKMAYRAGNRRDGSDSEYSYRSVVSAGGTRHVKRRRRREDGTYSDEESYHSDQDEAGKARRQKRRNVRKAQAIKEKKAALKKGKRDAGSDSDYSYRSVISAGGTRHVRRKKKRADGTYSDSESYHSSQDEDGEARRRNRRKKRDKALKKGKRDAGSDSDYSYRSVISAGGTRHVRRKKKRADGTYSDSESYHSSQDGDGEARRRKRRGERQKAFKAGKRRDDSDSDYSYRSVISAGGTRHVKRRRKRADGTYSDEESYHSSQDGEGEARRRRRRRDRKHAGSAHSYYSVASAGGTRHVRRKKKNADGTYGASESYHSSDSDAFDNKKGKKKRRQHGSDSDHSYFSEVSAGGTRTRKRRERIRDKHGKVIGYGKTENYSSDSDSDSPANRKKKGKKGIFTGSLASTDSEDEPDLSKMTEEEKEAYFAAKAIRKAEREKKRREKYGDKYDEMMEKHEKIKKGKKGVFTGSLASTDSEDEPDLSKMTKEEKEAYLAAKAIRKAEREKKRREKYGDKYDEMMMKHEKIKKGKKGVFTGSLASTDSEDEPDLSKMTKEEKEAYFAAKAIRKAEREKKRREKFGDKYDEMLKKHEKNKKGVFTGSLASTDSEDEPDLSKMTKEEKEAYFAAKAIRQAEREKKRREKFGDKYDEMMEKHKAKKAKSMVTYGKGNRFKDGEMDERGVGLGHDEWGKKGKKGKKDGNEADAEGDDGDMIGGRRRRKGSAGSDEESVYEYVRDKDGNIMVDKDGNPIKKKVGVVKKGMKKGKPGEIVDSDDEFNYMYDEDGNLVRKRKDSDDGDYFETLADGTIVLKKGKKKIDISKLTDDDLRRLGLDPDKMTKEEIARALKERFGDQIEIMKGGKKIGLKDIADYGSNPDTDDLADDSDLDTSTLKGQKKVRVMMRRGGQKLADHMKNIIDESKLTELENARPEEKDTAVDFLKHYQLVDQAKVDGYARAFVCEDDDYRGNINPRAARTALEAIPSVQQINKKELNYVLQVLDIDKESKLSFRMFAVMTALAERVTQMDAHCKELLEIANLTDIERKIELYRKLFYCSTEGDHNPNFIKVEALKIELMAGGLTWDQQSYIMSMMNPDSWFEVSFLDYLAYIPLFLSMHDTMLSNPLDMSNNQYTSPRREPSAMFRDQNPLGYPLKKDSVFMSKQKESKTLRKKADILLGAKSGADDVKNEGKELFNKYQKLPHIKDDVKPSSARKKH